MPDQTLQWRFCPLCGSRHYGRKPVGDIYVYSARGQKVARAVHPPLSPRPGYAHLECIADVRRRSFAAR